MKKNRLFNLPSELRMLIYDYDYTYHLIYFNCIKKITKSYVYFFKYFKNHL